MSTLSIIPGRIRLESKNLIGKGRLCAMLESKIRALDGIMEAEVNFRTGRLLIRFDESLAAGESVMENIKDIVESTSDENANVTYCGNISGIRHGNNDKRADSSLLHAFINIAGHMLMPKPLGMLLPIAINAISKKP